MLEGRGTRQIGPGPANLHRLFHHSQQPCSNCMPCYVRILFSFFSFHSVYSQLTKLNQKVFLQAKYALLKQYFSFVLQTCWYGIPGLLLSFPMLQPFQHHHPLTSLFAKSCWLRMSTRALTLISSVANVLPHPHHYAGIRIHCQSIDAASPRKCALTCRW